MTSSKARESNFFMEYSWVESGSALIGDASNVSVERGKTRVRTAALTRHRHPTGAVHRPASRLSMHLGTCATVGEKNITMW
ncbi:UNVERIFIED_CONTAM: hypothetical protein EX528_17080 [Xanthomonas axonopodis]